MTKPASVPTWATNATYAVSSQPWSATNTKVQPPSGVQNEGHNPEDPTVAQYENWWKNLVGQWTSHLNGTFTLIGRQLISANGTYTPTAGTLAVRLRMVGGGGGGGGGRNTTANVAAAAGGSGAAYLETWINPAATITGGAVSIGTAGTAGTAGGVGGTGGDTTIVIQGTTYTAKGGGGGTGSSLGGAGPSACAGGSVAAGTTAGDIVRFERGFPGNTINSAFAISGRGGGSTLGTGGTEQVTNGAVKAGVAGAGFGSGGSGGIGWNSGDGDGGAGAAGYIIVEEYA